MKKNIIFLALLTFLFQSFNTPLKKTEVQKIENYLSLQKYIEKKRIPIDLEKSLFLKKRSGFNPIAIFKNHNFYKKDINKFSIPDVFLFNNHSTLIDIDALGGCIIDRPKFENSDFYSEILKKNKILFKEGGNEVCTLDMFENNLCDFKGNPIFPFKKNKPCLIFIWAKNKTSINSLNDYINYTVKTVKQSKEEIDVYFLNVDDYSYL